MFKTASLLLIALLALSACQTRPNCVVTPNDLVECD